MTAWKLITTNLSTDVQQKLCCVNLEICCYAVSVLHTLKDLRGCLFYMICAVFQWTFLKILVSF